MLANSQPQSTGRPASLDERVVEFVALTGYALEKAAALEERQARIAAKTRELIPGVVDALVESGRIREDQRRKAASVLQDPVKALELLATVANHQGSAAPDRLGAPTGRLGKSAGVRWSSAPNNRQVRQSTVEYYRRLGLPVPASE